MDGTGAAADNGIMQIRYHNSLAKLKIRTEGSNLHFYNVTGCADLINSGDASRSPARTWSPGANHHQVLTMTPAFNRGRGR